MAGLVMGVHTFKEGYEQECSLGYLSPRPCSNSVQLALHQAEAGADTSNTHLLCNSVKRDSGGTDHSWFCQAGWDWLRTLLCTVLLHLWSYHPDKMTQQTGFKQVLFAHSGCQNRYRCLVPHCVSPFPELSDMPAVLA